MAPSGAAMAGVLALAEDLIGNRLSRSVADINPYPAPAVPRRHMPELIAVIVIVRIIIVAVRSAEADRKPPEVMTMIEEMAMVEERTMVQTGDMHSSWPDMHSSWPKGTDSRWTRSTESRWTRSTDSRWRRSAELRAAHGGTTALKTTAAAAAATTAVAGATTASLCKSIGRREGDANCRHCGNKKSDLSAHGTSPRIGSPPCKFNTTHAKLFRSRNVASGLFFFRRSHDRYDLLRQFSRRRQASMLAIHV